IWAHTFLFLFAILALSFVPVFRALRLVGFGVATHLLLDMIWIQPTVVWYPAYGWSFPMAPFNPGRWFDTLLHDPYVQAGEIIGFVCLVAFAWVYGIRSWKTLREFVVHGVLPRAAAKSTLNKVNAARGGNFVPVAFIHPAPHVVIMAAAHLNRRRLLALVLLSPVIAEMLSGSTPPLEWLNPIAVLFLIWLYGAGVLVMRETAVRWKTGW